MCCAEIKAHINGVKSTHYYLTNQGSGDKIAWVIDMLPWHATAQSETRETRHIILTCYAQTSYPNMQSANQKPGESDMLSQHAVA